MTQHEMGEIERPFVRRHIGALGHETHVAERAGFLDLRVVFLLHAVELAGRTIVDQIEQPREGVAEIEAATAPVTDVEDALHFLFEGRLVPEPGILPIQVVTDRCFEAAFAHGRPALLAAGGDRG